MLVRPLPMKSRKRLARDVIDTFATHSYLVQDVTSADWRALDLSWALLRVQHHLSSLDLAWTRK